MTWIPLAISLGAILGALSRYYITLFWVARRGPAFPYGTLTVNLVGAFVIGLITTWTANFAFPLGLQKLLMVGFLGAFTTFSSYALDTANLFRTHHPSIALLYWLGSPLLGLVAVEAGILIGQAWSGA